MSSAINLDMGFYKSEQKTAINLPRTTDMKDRYNENTDRRRLHCTHRRKTPRKTLNSISNNFMSQTFSAIFDCMLRTPVTQRLQH